MGSSPWRILYAFLLLSITNIHTVSASVLAIDYGTDSTKVSLMKPGVPFDVILNRDSKRKIASSVAWKGNDRLFGADAINIATRFPTESFPSLKLLQGAPYNAYASYFYSTLYPWLEMSETPARNTHTFKRSDGTEWTNEELVAMQFSYIKELAESVGGERVRDAVVTVPAYYSQYERQAVLDSLELAGLRGISLVNDGTAIAVNYAMSRTFQEEEEHHIIYDAGASGIRATLVSFQTIQEPVSKKSKKTNDVNHITVKGFGYDVVASSSEMDLRIRNLLKEKFESVHGRSIEKEPKAIAKLWKEASRVKTILSANTDSRVSIESFVWDIDFKTAITRAEFEDVCEDLVPRYAKPILDALHGTGLSLSDISSVILAGGASRIPMVQAAIKATVGQDKIAQNVNADEAAVLGAAFYGASLSRQFKTKETRVEDRLFHHDIQVSYVSESKSGGHRTINTVVFPAGTKYGARKTLTFKRKDDFNITFSYKDQENPNIPSQIMEAEITGVSEAITNLTDRGALEPVVKLTAGLSDSGMAVLYDAFAYGEVRDESITGKLKGLFGSNPPAENGEDESVDEAPPAPSDEPEPEPAKPVPNNIPISADIRNLSIQPYSAEELSASRKRLIAVDQAEKVTRKREEARNMLEGYLYRLRDLLDGEELSPFLLFSKPEERKKLEEKMNDAFRWMNEEAETADLKDLWGRREEMEIIEKPIQFRYEEHEAAPKELENLSKALYAGQVFLQSANQNRTMEEKEGLPHKYTEEELADVATRLKETQEWLDEGVAEQKKLKKNDDPVLISAEMKARGVTLQNHVKKMLNRKTPKPPPKPKKSEEPAPESTPAGEGSSEGAGTEGKRVHEDL